MEPVTFSQKPFKDQGEYDRLGNWTRAARTELQLNPFSYDKGAVLKDIHEIESRRAGMIIDMTARVVAAEVTLPLATYSQGQLDVFENESFDD